MYSLIWKWSCRLFGMIRVRIWLEYILHDCHCNIARIIDLVYVLHNWPYNTFGMIYIKMHPAWLTINYTLHADMEEEDKIKHYNTFCILGIHPSQTKLCKAKILTSAQRPIKQQNLSPIYLIAITFSFISKIPNNGCLVFFSFWCSQCIAYYIFHLSQFCQTTTDH